jgi:hypothetical protein
MNDYQKRQAACDCLPAERRGFIKSALDFTEDFPDGAFLAYMEEQGIDISELEAFAESHDCKGLGGKP